MVQESTPRRRVTLAAHREGERELVRGCRDVLAGTRRDSDLLWVLGGDSAPAVLEGRAGGPDGYWPRTWALRAFLYVWDPPAEGAVVAACSDEHWRVREMAAKVMAVRRPTSPASQEALARLRTDAHHRVRAAAGRALRPMA
jgi:hypothetical protein